MAESKLAFQIASSLATQHLTDSKYIQGTYHVVETIADRDALTIKTDTKDGIIVTGSLVYVSDEGKSYRYNGTAYEEEAGGGSGGSTVGWKYKGEVATAANLPTGPAKGDIYTVTSKVVDGETVADGHNYFAHMQSLEIPLVDELSTAPIMCQCFELFDRKEIEDAFQNYPYFGAYSHPGPTQITLIFSNNPIILGITSTNGEVERVLAKADEEFKIFGARKVSNTEKILVNVTLTKGTNTVTIDGEEYTYYSISAPEVTWNTFYYYNNVTWLWANYLPKTFDFRTSTKADMTYYNQKEVEIVPSGLVWKLVSGVDDGSEEDPHLEAIKTAISTNDEDGNICNIVGETWVMDNEGWITNTENCDLMFRTQDGPISGTPSAYSKLVLSADGNGFEIESKNAGSGKTFKFGTNATDLQGATADTTYTVKTDGIYLNDVKITGGTTDTVDFELGRRPSDKLAIGGLFYCELLDPTPDLITHTYEGGTVVSIEYGALDNVPTTTTELVIPPEVNSLGMGVLDGDVEHNIKSIIDQDYLTYVDTYCCIGKSSLELLDLGNNITTIVGVSFSGCNNLAEVHLPESLTVLNNSTFNGCVKLAKINFPTTLTAIKDQVFSNCGFTSIDLSKCTQLVEIGYSAFSDCQSLTEVILPASITLLYSGLFSGCTSLTRVVDPANCITESNYSDLGITDYSIVVHTS